MLKFLADFVDRQSMKVPLVSDSRFDDQVSSFSRSPFNSSERNSLFETSFHVASDAAKTNIQNTSQEAQEILQEEESPIRIQGFFESALREIGRLSKELLDVQDQMENAAAGVPGRELLEAQERLLSEEIQRIVQSDSFQRAVQVADAIETALQTGLVSRRSLSPATALLGDNFLQLASQGNGAAVASLSRGLQDLSDLQASDFLASPAAVNAVQEKISQLLSRLQSARFQETPESKEGELESTPLTQAPESSDLSFQAAGEIAISMQMYSGKDLIRAVASGYATNSDELFQLRIESLRQKDDEESEQEKVQTKIEEARTAQGNGLSIDRESF